MLPLVRTVCSFVTDHVVGTATAVLAFLGAATIAYAREQVRAGTDWALAPLTKILPWNRRTVPTAEHETLVSDFSLVEIFLLDTKGKLARYQKTSGYVTASNELTSYREGVTAEGHADAFSTMRGTIAETLKIHGFYMSRIELIGALEKGSRFTNIYKADLHDCFTKHEEHWTQEVAFPTKHLTLQIHFPEDRPPRSIKCSAVEGTADRSLQTAAKIVDLFGKRAIVWEVHHPSLKEVLKLEWTW